MTLTPNQRHVFETAFTAYSNAMHDLEAQFLAQICRDVGADPDEARLHWEALKLRVYYQFHDALPNGNNYPPWRRRG